MQTDGKIVAAGYSNCGYDCDDELALARYTTAGNLDPSFGTDGQTHTDLGQASSLAIDKDGKIVVAGFSGGDSGLARYTPAGKLDKSFGSGGTVLPVFAAHAYDWATAVAVQTDGKIVVAGSNGRADDDTNDFALARYTTRGDPDSSFGTGGKVLAHLGTGTNNATSAVVLQKDQKIVIAGSSVAWGLGNFALLRYTTDGKPDATFGSAGAALTDLGPS